MTIKLVLSASIAAIYYSHNSIGVSAAAANQADYPACPINHKPEYFCCETNAGTKLLFTKYKRPTASESYASLYEKGWAASRQINFPNAAYTPDTPSFLHTDASTRCAVTWVVDPKNTSNRVKQLQCATSKSSHPSVLVNTSLAIDHDGSSFMTYNENERNNDATCPDNAKWTQVYSAEERKACFTGKPDKTSLYSTYLEAPFLCLYAAFLALAIGKFSWVAFKNASYKQEDDLKAKLALDRGGPTTPSTLSMMVEEPTVDAYDGIKQTGYADHLFGQFLLGVIGFLTVLLNAIMLLLILDNYSFLPVQLLVPGEPLLAFFIAIWTTTTVWLTVIVLSQNSIRNFFRLKVPLSVCTYVHTFKPMDAEVMLQDRSGVSDFVAKVESALFSKMTAIGHEETIPVAKTSAGSRVIEFQHMRYFYDTSASRFVPGSVSLGATYVDLEREATGLSSQMHSDRLDVIGPNSIEIAMPSVATSLVNEFFSFFYIYQIMCYYVWFYHSYWNMGIVMTVVIGASAAINILTKRRMQQSVVEMTRYSTDVTVSRDYGQSVKIVKSRDLVPGDLVKVQENWILPCDMVIVQGSTVCDESMLTGESMPVQKFPIPSGSTDAYDSLGAGKKHTLFSGAKVLSSGRDEELWALVQATGAHTSKGQLVQNILYPVPMRFKYDEHLKVVIFALLIYGLVASYLVITFLYGNGSMNDPLNAWCYGIFMLSCILSPLLPVVITVGQVNAARRLEGMGVFSLNAQRIVLCGKIRVFCFDKTGTLTKEGLDFLGCVTPSIGEMIFPTARNIQKDLTTLSCEMQMAMSSCHALGSLNGELVGNQVELKMFEATGCKLVEEEGVAPVVIGSNNYGGVNGSNQMRLEVVKRFEFDHHRMSMSVVMRDLNTSKLYVFCKGSYEKMQVLSHPESLPSNYAETADALARDGCYVLGMAMNELPEMNAAELELFLKSRDTVESHLSFLGLFMFRNELKSDTRDAILQLKAGDTRVVMITGDNAMCGCYIARECGMVDLDKRVILGDMVKDGESQMVLQWANVDTREIHSMEEIKALCEMPDNDIELAVTGKAFDYLVDNGDMKTLLMHTRIFSRMTPNGKVTCVQMHMDTGAVTGMCGDGGNDCGALRVAHAGIALSDAEASVVSPFTSKPKTITSVVDLCREGRCSVATSFASVKMLIMYGLISSTLRFVQYYNGVIVAEWCFVLSDGFILVGLSYVLTLAKPLPRLGSQRPTSSLIGPTTLTSILGQQVINVMFLAFGLRHLTTQPWYCPFNPGTIDMAKWWLLSDSTLATCLFFCIVFQQQTAAFVFSFGSRYRQAIWKNYSLVVFYSALIVLDFYLVLSDPNWFTDIFRIASSTNVIGLPDIPLSFEFRREFLYIVLSNFLAVVLFEYLVVLGPVRNYFRAKYHHDSIPMRL